MRKWKKVKVTSGKFGAYLPTHIRYLQYVYINLKPGLMLKTVQELVDAKAAYRNDPTEADL